MDKVRIEAEVTKEELKENELLEFAELMGQIGELPKDAREQVKIFAQGMLAMMRHCNL